MVFNWPKRGRATTTSGTDRPAAHPPETPVAAAPSDGDVRLFPGFEREDFEVGVRDGRLPALVMRWKDGGAWFALPPMFNRAVLTALTERETDAALPPLLNRYGYAFDDAA